MDLSSVASDGAEASVNMLLTWIRCNVHTVVAKTSRLVCDTPVAAWDIPGLAAPLSTMSFRFFGLAAFCNWYCCFLASRLFFSGLVISTLAPSRLPSTVFLCLAEFGIPSRFGPCGSRALGISVPGLSAPSSVVPRPLGLSASRPLRAVKHAVPHNIIPAIW